MNSRENHGKDHDLALPTDDELSAGYRAIADEPVPARLDKIILRHATRDVRGPGNWLTYINTYRRPLAFAATLTLTLSIVLQFQDVFEGPTPDAVNGISDTAEFSAAITAGAEHLQEQARQGENIASQGLLNKPMPRTVGGADDMRPTVARFCDARQTVSAETWWACIVELEKRGRTEDAAIENQLLINTYPDFAPTK